MPEAFWIVTVIILLIAVFAALGSSTNSANKKINYTRRLIDNEKKDREKQDARTEENISSLETALFEKHRDLERFAYNEADKHKAMIRRQSEEIERLKSEIEELNRKLSIFTEIGADSKELNSDFSREENDKLIDDLLESVENEKPKSAPEIISSVAAASAGGNLDEEQKAAFRAMENTNENFFITGKAGTGKSFLLRMFERGTSKKVLKLAPTGVAALNIGGATIHSVFGFNNLEQTDIDDISERTVSLSSSTQVVLREIETIIIDEISMVNADIFEKISEILKQVAKSNKPFGGKQMLIFGDVFQLPPVVGREEEKRLKNRFGGVFFFDSAAYRDGKFNFIELKINHRQEGDHRFFEVLNHVREGNLTDEDLDLVNQRVVKDPDALRRIVRLYPKRKDAERVNSEELDKIPAREHSFEAVIDINKLRDKVIDIEKYFQVSAVLKLKKGALVMLTKNDAGKRWVNGTLGIVSRIEDGHVFVTINDMEHEVTPEAFEQREPVYEDGEISYRVVLRVVQFPILLAYAITIHKSQGSTYKRIACDPYDCFAPGQAYVALSRCESLSGLHLLKALSPEKIKVDFHVKEFYLEQSKQQDSFEEANTDITSEDNEI